MKKHFTIWQTFTMAASFVALVLGSATASATSLPGPDSFGYTGSNIAYNLRSGVTDFVVSGDDNYTTVTLPFAFNFYGTSFTTMDVSTNGLTGFPLNSAWCCNGQPIPNPSAPNAYIAPAWMDWVGTVTSATFGSVGSREFVLQWDVVEFAGPPALFQEILHEGSNAIEMQFSHMNTGFHVATTGIENLDGTDGLQYAHGAYTLDQQGLLFSVPEPGSFALLGLGLVALESSALRWRRN